MAIVIKVVSPPMPNGFVNGFTEWFKGEAGGMAILTREPLCAARLTADNVKAALDLCAADYPSATVTAEGAD